MNPALLVALLFVTAAALAVAAIKLGTRADGMHAALRRAAEHTARAAHACARAYQAGRVLRGTVALPPGTKPALAPNSGQWCVVYRVDYALSGPGTAVEAMFDNPTTHAMPFVLDGTEPRSVELHGEIRFVLDDPEGRRLFWSGAFVKPRPSDARVGEILDNKERDPKTYEAFTESLWWLNLTDGTVCVGLHPSCASVHDNALGLDNRERGPARFVEWTLSVGDSVAIAAAARSITESGDRIVVHDPWIHVGVLRDTAQLVERSDALAAWCERAAVRRRWTQRGMTALAMVMLAAAFVTPFAPLIYRSM